MNTLASMRLPFFYLRSVCLAKPGHLHVLPAVAPFYTLRDPPL